VAPIALLLNDGEGKVRMAAMDALARGEVVRPFQAIAIREPACYDAPQNWSMSVQDGSEWD